MKFLKAREKMWRDVRTRNYGNTVCLGSRVRERFFCSRSIAERAIEEAIAQSEEVENQKKRIAKEKAEEARRRKNEQDRYRRQKLKEKREWQNSAEDFTLGAEVWVIDLVAPYGGVRGIVRDMRRELSLRYPNRHAHWIRNNMTAERRLGRGERGSARAES